MQSGKKKSSGWRPSDKRRTVAEHQARHFTRQAAAGQHESDRLGRWRDCPVRRCRRVGHCNTEVLQCQRRPRAASAQQRNAAPRAPDAATAAPAQAQPAAPVMPTAKGPAATKVPVDSGPPRAFNRNDLPALRNAGLI